MQQQRLPVTFSTVVKTVDVPGFIAQAFYNCGPLSCLMLKIMDRGIFMYFEL